MRKKKEVSAKTMISILECDVKQFDPLNDEELDTVVGFLGDYGYDYACTLRDIQYTYRFCKELLESCVEKGYLK